MAGNLTDWAPYYNYVQGGMVDGNFASGAFTVVAAGPPRLSAVGGAAALAGGAGGSAAGIASGVTSLLGGSSLGSLVNSGINAASGGGSIGQIVYPIGIVQNFNLSQTRAFMRVWEVGSERSYFIAGRNMGQIGLGRIYYSGPSLLRVLYAYYQDMMGPVTIPPLWANEGMATQANPHDVVIPPGYNNIFLNLASDLFAQPIGLMLMIRDVNLNTLGSIYFEACYVPSHTWGVDAQGVVIQEQAGIQYERAVPVQVAGLSLLSSANAGGSNMVNSWI